MTRELSATGQPHPLRALVVEDEWPARNYLVELLEASNLAEIVGAVASLDANGAIAGGKRRAFWPPSARCFWLVVSALQIG